MNVLITGGSGYIGANVVEQILNNDQVESVTVYDNFSKKNFSVLTLLNGQKHQKLNVHCSDILDNKSLGRSVQVADVIIHLAAVCRTPFNDENPQYFDQVNHWGTASLVGEIVKSTSSKRVLFASSGSIYGRTESEASISSVPHPVTSYAKSKLAAENQIRRLSGKHHVSIFRLGNVFGFGKSMRFDAVINRFFLDCIFNRPLKIEGDGNQTRPFIPLKVAVSMIESFLVDDRLIGLFNINTHNWSVNEVVDGYKAIFDRTEIIHVNQNEKLGCLMMAPSQMIMELQSKSIVKDVKFYLGQMEEQFKLLRTDF
jgi:UDP-glucose 4-epimerase